MSDDTEEESSRGSVLLKTSQKRKQRLVSVGQENDVEVREKNEPNSNVTINMEDETVAFEDFHHDNASRSESNVSNQLRRAITQSSYELCMKHLDEGMNINSVDETDGSNGLHFLASKSLKGDLRTLKIALLFLERGCNVEAKDLKGNTPLHIAAREGLEYICNIFIEHAERVQIPLINCSNVKGMTALHLAAKEGQCEVVELLLRRGAKPNMKDNTSCFPLHYAVDKGCVVCCRALAPYYQGDATLTKNQVPPLIQAAKKGHYNTCKELPVEKLDVNIKNSDGNTALHIAAKKGFHKFLVFLLELRASPDTPNNYGWTPMMGAVAKDKEECVSVLVERGASLTARNYDHCNVLHIAASSKSNKCMTYLLENDEVRKLINEKNKDGFTPLLLAVQKKSDICIKLLEEAGASPLVGNEGKVSVLYNSPHYRESCILSDMLLLEKDVNQINEDKITPLHMAAQRGLTDACKSLLRKGARINACDKDGRTALHYAAYSGHENTLKLLLKNGAPRRVKDDKKFTALHCAAFNGKLECCKVLLEHDRGFIKEKEKKGKYALDLAFEQGRYDVCIFLLEKFSEKTYVIPLDLAERFHSYVHKMLSNKKRVLLEAVIRSNWWAAGFGLVWIRKDGEEVQEKRDGESVQTRRDCEAVQTRRNVKVVQKRRNGDAVQTRKNSEAGQTRRNGEAVQTRRNGDAVQTRRNGEAVQTRKNGDAEQTRRRGEATHTKVAGDIVQSRMHGEAPCLLFRDIVKVFPELAYEIMTKCYLKKEFGLLEDNYWVQKEGPDTSHAAEANCTVEKTVDMEATQSQKRGDSANLLVRNRLNWKLQHPVNTMVTKECLPLLQHPLTKTWLDFKWRAYARLIFVMLMFIRALYILCLVILLCSIRNSIASKMKKTNGIHNVTSGVSPTATALEDGPSPDNLTVSPSIQWPMLAFFFLHLLAEVYRWCRLGLKNNWMLWLVQLVGLLLTLATLVTANTSDTMAYGFGVVALVLAGLHFIHRIDQLPSLNILSSITRNFIRKYVKGLMYATCIVTLFAFIFYLLFLGEKEFKSMPYAILSIALWQMGDFNQEIFFKDIEFPIISHIFFIVYLCTFGAFIVTIIKAPSSTRETSLLNKEINMINLIFEIDVCFPCARKVCKGDALKDNKSRETAKLKDRLGFKKACEREENEAPMDETIFLFNDKCKQCKTVSRNEEKSENRSTEVMMGKLQELMQEIKSLRGQIRLLHHRTDH